MSGGDRRKDWLSFLCLQKSSKSPGAAQATECARSGQEAITLDLCYKVLSSEF